MSRTIQTPMENNGTHNWFKLFSGLCLKFGLKGFKSDHFLIGTLKSGGMSELSNSLTKNMERCNNWPNQ